MKWMVRQFEISRNDSFGNIPSMEGIRGFAVFLIFIVHYCTIVTPWIYEDESVFLVLRCLQKIGHVGVDMFFVLSGYLIYGSLIAKEQNYFRFMYKRIRRVYPAFIVVFLMYVGLSLFFPSENKIPSHAPFIYLLQNLLFLPGLFPIQPMISVAWSLSYEMFYYLAAPIAIALFKLRRRTEWWRIIIIFLVAIATLIFCKTNDGHIRMVMFMAGMLLYESVKILKTPAPSGTFATLSLIAGILAALLPISDFAKSIVIFMSFYVFFLNCFLRPYDLLAKVFACRPLRWLGNISYSYYLIHGLALKAGFLALSHMFQPAGEWGGVIFVMLLLSMFLLTLIPSILLFVLVERPISLAPATNLSARSKPNRMAW